MDQRITKLFKAETKAIDASRIHAVMSTEKRDRDGDVIRQAGWDLDEFMQHPILLSSHNYGSLMSQIGAWEDVSVKNKQLQGVARYYVGEGNQEADWGYKLASKGVAAYSVGFIPDMDKAKELKDSDGWFPNWEFNGQKLLETSHVTVPSNPDALQSSVAKGLIHPAVLAVYGLDAWVFDRAGGDTVDDATARLAQIVKDHGDHNHDKDGKHDHPEFEGKALANEFALLRQEFDAFLMNYEKAHAVKYSDLFREAFQEVARNGH